MILVNFSGLAKNGPGEARNRSNMIGYDSSATIEPQAHLYPKKGGLKTLEAIPWYHLDFNERYAYPYGGS